MAKEVKLRRTKSGKMDKRTKEGKAIAEKLAKARAARKATKKGVFSFLFGSKKK